MQVVGTAVSAVEGGGTLLGESAIAERPFANVIAETLAGKGNITSTFSLNAEEALNAGLEFLGEGYQEIGKPNSGVFENIVDGVRRQFRMDTNSLLGRHLPNVPHVHFSIYEIGEGSPLVNNHVPLVPYIQIIVDNWRAMVIRNHVGRIRKGQYRDWYVYVQETPAPGDPSMGCLVLIVEHPGRADSRGYDDWVLSEDVNAYFKSVDWDVEWLSDEDSIRISKGMFSE